MRICLLIVLCLLSIEIHAQTSPYRTISPEVILNHLDSSVSINGIFSLSDLNMDGIQDFAVIIDDQSKETTIDIYFAGKSSFNQPDHQISLNEKYLLLGQSTVGNFDRDENTEIILLLDVITEANVAEPIIGIVDIDLSAETPVIQLLDGEDYLPETLFDFQFRNKFKNIGDINGDGIDDLSINLIKDRYNTYLFTNPDSVITKQKYIFSDEINSIVSLGDFLGDGSPTFAAANYLKYVTENDQVKAIGAVSLYQFNGESDSPILLDTLFIPFSNQDLPNVRGFGYSMTTGDFDNDSFPELIISATSSTNLENSDGNDLFFIFKGGESYDGSIEYSFPLPIKFFYPEAEVTDLQSGIDHYRILSLPDANNDGGNELLMQSFKGNFSSFLFQSRKGTTLNFEEPVIFEKNNESLENANFEPVIGSINNISGNLDIMISQVDGNIYLYEVNEELITSNQTESFEAPLTITLNQNYPNPFNPTTNIQFSIPSNGQVNVSVYNSLGLKVAEIADGQFNAGKHIIQFDGTRLASGLYIYKLSTIDQTITKKMLLVK